MDKGNKVFYGWWIVATTFIVLFAGLCSGFYTVSVFLEPLQAEFGCTRTQVSLGFTIAAMMVGFLSPVAGIAVAKVGIKKVQIAGALITGASLFMMSYMQTLGQYYALFILMAIGLVSVGVVPAQTLISFWFNKKRGLAMGIIMTGIGLGGMAMVFVASEAVSALGWRIAYRVLAFIVLGVVIPVVLLVIKNTPQEMGLSQDGVEQNTLNLGGLTTGLSFNVKQAFGTLSFKLLCLTMALYSLILGGLNQHAISMLGSMDITNAALFWSLTLGISVLGRIVFGGLADRVSKKVLLIVIWALHVTGLAVLFYLPAHQAVIWGFVALYGIALGSFVTLFPLFVGENFGIEHFSKLVGIAGLFQVLGMAIGSILLGKMYDGAGTYSGGIKVLVIVSLLALVLTVLMKKPDPPEEL